MLLMLGAFLGGLGIFLLAISMITDGLKLAAGEALRKILSLSTRTPWRGVASGIVVTGIVQSSSAVTVATIGFVNAGLLTLPQSLGVVYGANIGTTMTGWLVAAMGFKINVEAFALPLIGLGMVARLVGSASRLGALGEAIAGFGLFFIGVDILQRTFGGLAENVDLTALTSSTGLDFVMYLGIGFLMTLVTQSSSAAIALTLTAATGGILALDAAATMVIGANVGTTSTAAFAVLGATPNAKRVAAAHVIFNLMTGVVALFLLPLLLKFVAMTSNVLGLVAVPAIALALFHTTFNILGVLIAWPFTEKLAGFLLNRFKTSAEMLGRPMYLDSNVLITPLLGMDALRLEINRIAMISREHAIDAVTRLRPSKALNDNQLALCSLTDGVENFIMKLEKQRIPANLTTHIQLALRINNYVEEVASLAYELATRGSEIDSIAQGRMAEPIGHFRQQVTYILRNCDPTVDGFDSANLTEQYQSLRTVWRDLKSNLLAAASRGELPISRLNSALESLRSCLRIAEQSTKIAQRCLELNTQSAKNTDPVSADLAST